MPTGLISRRKRYKRIYEECKKKGICISCQKVPARKGKVECQDCQNKKQKNHRKPKLFKKNHARMSSVGTI